MPLSGEAKRAYQREYMRGRRARQRAAVALTRPPAPALPADLAAWCSELLVTQGANVGDNLTLWPWEVDVLRRLEALDGGELGLTVAAGAGKTTLAAAVCAAAVAGPLAQPRGSVIGVAGSFAQALILADHVQAFLKPMTDADPNRWRVLRSESAALVEDRETGAQFRAREANARTLHGSAPSLIVADEPAQWAPTQAPALYSAIRSRLGKLEDSRLFAIGRAALTRRTGSLGCWNDPGSSTRPTRTRTRSTRRRGKPLTPPSRICRSSGRSTNGRRPRRRRTRVCYRRSGRCVATWEASTMRSRC